MDILDKAMWHAWLRALADDPTQTPQNYNKEIHKFSGLSLQSRDLQMSRLSELAYSLIARTLQDTQLSVITSIMSSREHSKRLS